MVYLPTFGSFMGNIPYMDPMGLNHHIFHLCHRRNEKRRAGLKNSTLMSVQQGGDQLLHPQHWLWQLAGQVI